MPDKLIYKRKNRHLEYFKNHPETPATNTTLFEEVYPEPSPFGGIDWNNIDTSFSFLNCTFNLPVQISSITGGTKTSEKLNKDLCKLASNHNIPFILGSLRPLFDDPDCISGYQFKKNPNVFLGANLGLFQALEYGPDRINEVVKQFKFIALYLHLNIIQELVQPEGDRNFSFKIDHLRDLLNSIAIPVIIKETGSGFSWSSKTLLNQIEPAGIEISGTGGTSFLAVELDNLSSENQQIHAPFENWGIPTAASLLNLTGLKFPKIASGGIRTGLDVAKAIILGADFAGIAAPFLTSWQKHGYQGLDNLINTIKYQLKLSMLLCGAANLNQLSQTPYRLGPLLKNFLKPPRSNAK
ncbi:MAG: type 2 isopentenyl-diphosphate Delta-isomerase [Deltaproteobacteria bacterium]|jgi:isopentenyl-diphosphate delta-isomerase|nr:type 2 isopentenyl-diphosphate Delta-isomerase [Deltaproteobacteria bacterium]